MSVANKKTVLLTLGRLPKALDIAECLSKAGCKVLIAEPFAWHLCRVSKYVDACFVTPSPVDDQQAYLSALLEIIEQEKVSLVVPVSEEILHANLLTLALPGGCRFFAEDHSLIKTLHDKYQFNQLAQSFGLDVPETHLLGTDDAQKLSGRSDYILKPANTCSGKGFSSHSSSEQLPQSSQAEMLVQQKMNGALKSTFSICDQGRVIGTIVYQAAILSDSVAVAFERLEDEKQIQNWIEVFVGKTGHSGFIAFDMMEDENGVPHAIECNPRATSGIHFVDRDDLANAILRPDKQLGLRSRPEKLMYQFWSSLTETQAAVFKSGSALQKAKIMLKAREVNFSWRDPLPLWLMPFTSWSIMKRAFLKGESFGEASMHDLEWKGESEGRAIKSGKLEQEKRINDSAKASEKADASKNANQNTTAIA
ncbi:MAG: ATP-grasp domain-containing protein [Rhizobiaceae bacterium]|nr:ATP-grasp domain-containing protein [Rhizobiaceae bacterium]